LDQETSVNVGKCVVKDSPLGDFAAHNSTAIFDATFTTPRVLATRAATLSEHNNTVMTLEGGIVPPPQLDKLRFSLSLDACRGCHGMETRGELRPAKPQGGFRQFTQFDQIKYREKGHSSQLSPFLAGKFSDPSFIPWPVKPPTVIACPGAPSPQARNYDDLLRRFLFHLAVLIVPQDDWDATFRRMQLTAFQTH
jgi:hypothetical protein